MFTKKKRSTSVFWSGIYIIWWHLFSVLCHLSEVHPLKLQVDFRMMCWQKVLNISTFYSIHEYYFYLGEGDEWPRLTCKLQRCLKKFRNSEKKSDMAHFNLYCLHLKATRKYSTNKSTLWPNVCSVNSSVLWIQRQRDWLNESHNKCFVNIWHVMLYWLAFSSIISQSVRFFFSVSCDNHVIWKRIHH